MRIMFRKSTILLTALAVIFTAAGAGTAVSLRRAQSRYQPREGEAGKDVMWVPTPTRFVEAMLDLARLSADDYLIDLGSGDGRIVIAAAKRGAHALGIEYNPSLVELSKRNAEMEGVAARASFMQGDLFQADFSKATVITMYLLPEINLKLRPQILQMQPGTRVVSHAFNMDDWEADQTSIVAGRKAWFWIVPARVDGIWAWQAASGEATLTIAQKFQKIEGSLNVHGKKLALKNARLLGSQISFAAGESPATMHQYSGTVSGEIVHGIEKAGTGKGIRWTAHRRPGTAAPQRGTPDPAP
jgi:SAM-dependent methyltransferase